MLKSKGQRASYTKPWGFDLTSRDRPRHVQNTTETWHGVIGAVLGVIEAEKGRYMLCLLNAATPPCEDLPLVFSTLPSSYFTWYPFATTALRLHQRNFFCKQWVVVIAEMYNWSENKYLLSSESKPGHWYHPVQMPGNAVEEGWRQGVEGWGGVLWNAVVWKWHCEVKNLCYM